jgi:hypothetical protein
MIVVTAFRFITILLAARALTMESAHVLELPQKMQYVALMYSAVNATLYRHFAIVGGVYQIGSIVAAAAGHVPAPPPRSPGEWGLSNHGQIGGGGRWQSGVQLSAR